MRIVGREHEQLRTGLLDHPAEGLARIGRELEVAAHVLRGLELEGAQRLLGAAERTLAVIEMAEPRHDPAGALFDTTAPQLGEAIEEPVEDERAEERLR